MIDARIRDLLCTAVLVGAAGAFLLTAGCARQVRVESGPSESDTTDRDTTALRVDAGAVPSFEAPDPEPARR